METRPCGRHAVLVEVSSAHESVDLAAWGRASGLAREVVPGAETVLFDGLLDPARLAAELATWTPGAAPVGTLVEVPVTYDGPDLGFVAGHWGCAEDEVVERHLATEFVSAFCGFVPGFAYLTGLRDAVPRLETPRTRVPAGAVALADTWCGVYPGESPGGWRIIGRTDARLWDARRAEPALLPPGTRVRFVSR
jgi:KipI family sensor histidine kinase inhibitor